MRAMPTASEGKALDLVAPHCDIVTRLGDVPPSARVRGLYFRSVLGVLRSRERLASYDEYFPGERWSSLTFYPVGDYLLRAAVAGALLTSPQSLHEGVFEIGRQNATAFAASLLGRAMLRILDRDPVRLTQQGLAARRQSMSYGEWAIKQAGPRELEMTYHGEYMWIESAIAGAAVGTFESCGVKAELKTVLTDKYNGSTVVRW